MATIGLSCAKVWWVIMLILCFTGIGLEVSSLSIPRWFYQGQGLYRWEGGLLTPYPSQTLYKDKACDRDFHGNGYCNMFTNLWIGGIVYIVFELISMLMFLGALIVYIILLVHSKSLALCATILNWLAVSAHLIGFSTWAALGKMQYQGTCNSYYTDNGSNPGNICRAEGATMGLAIVLYIPLIAMLQTVLWNQQRNDVEIVKEKNIVEYKNPNDNPEFSSREESSREVVSDPAEMSK